MTNSVETAAAAAPSAPDPSPRNDLLDLVTAALRDAGHTNPGAWVPRLPMGYTTAPTVGHQIFLINRCWRVLIAEVHDVDSSDVRYCLVDTPNVDDWLRVFTGGVVPWVTKHNLPLTKS